MAQPPAGVGGTPPQQIGIVPPACMARVKDTSVAVIGAGLGGLMAARKLADHGANVTLFEASERVGGRVYSNTTLAKGRVIEEGAELIATFHSTWLELAREYGIGLITRTSEKPYEAAGLKLMLTLDAPISWPEYHTLEADVVKRVLRPLAEIAYECIPDPERPWDHKDRDCENKYHKGKLADYDTTVTKGLKGFCGVEPTGNKRLWAYLEHLLVNDEVAPLDKMSFLGLLCKVRAAQPAVITHDSQYMLYWEELEVFRCADGCYKLATELAQDVGKRTNRKNARLLMPADVASVAIDDSGATVYFYVPTVSEETLKEALKLGAQKPKPGDLEPPKDQSRKVKVPFFKRFDYVVFAIPPPVWSRVTVSWAPKPIDLSRKPIDLAKVVGLMHSEPAIKFFRATEQRFWIKNGEAPVGGTPTLGQVWEATDNQCQIWEGAQFDKAKGPPAVLAVFAGPIRSGSPPDRRQCMAELSKLYKDYGTYYKDKNTLYVDWPHTPFIMTGYASPLPGEIFKIGPNLHKGLHERLFFAGEHTSMGFFGYMEGALRSGLRAAAAVISQLCKVYQLPTKPEPHIAVASATPLKREVPAWEAPEAPEAPLPMAVGASSDERVWGYAGPPNWPPVSRRAHAGAGSAALEGPFLMPEVPPSPRSYSTPAPVARAASPAPLRIVEARLPMVSSPKSAVARPSCAHTRRIISGFPEYAVTPADLGEEAHQVLRQIAGEIVRSAGTSEPIVAVLAIGHADTALRKPPVERPELEHRISIQRAEEALKHLRRELERQSRGSAALGSVQWQARGAGSTQRLLARPTTEAERRLNRRVEVLMARCQLPPVPPPSTDPLEQHIERLSKLLETRRVDPDTTGTRTRRARCLLEKLRRPDVIDVFVDGSLTNETINGRTPKAQECLVFGRNVGWLGNYDGTKKPMPTSEFLKFLQTARPILRGEGFGPGHSDEHVLRALGELVLAIDQGIEMVDAYIARMGMTSDPIVKRLFQIDGFAGDVARKKLQSLYRKQLDDEDNIYSCYR